MIVVGLPRSLALSLQTCISIHLQNKLVMLNSYGADSFHSESHAIEVMILGFVCSFLSFKCMFKRKNSS